MKEMLLIPAVLAVSTLINFLNIHPMANLVLFNGSSREKSFNLSLELGLLTTVYASIAAVAFRFAKTTQFFQKELAYASILAGYLLIVVLFKVWDIRERYDTTALYAFIIGEAPTLFALGVFLLFRHAYLGLV